MHTTRKNHGAGSRFHRFMVEIGRYFWLDLPLLALWYLNLQHFWTQGRYPAPDWFTYLCWGLLGMYVPVKEDAHKRFPDMRSRWGLIRVLIWILLVVLCALLNSRNPERFSAIPPLMPETTLVVVGAFVLGLYFSKKRVIPKLIEALGKLSARYAR